MDVVILLTTPCLKCCFFLQSVLVTVIPNTVIFPFAICHYCFFIAHFLLLLLLLLSSRIFRESLCLNNILTCCTYPLPSWFANKDYVEFLFLFFGNSSTYTKHSAWNTAFIHQKLTQMNPSIGICVTPTIKKIVQPTREMVWRKKGLDKMLNLQYSVVCLASRDVHICLSLS